MKRTWTLLSILFIHCIVFAQPVVKTTTGFISGTTIRNGSVQAYKGIPFAAPPIGDLRWKPPQPVAPWTGIKKCEQFGPSPMQTSPAPFSMWTEEFLIPKEPISEDCLYLNIWTSSKKQNKKPVLVWIYGGGFQSGGSAVPIYDGEAMASKDVVFVSINYRVGVFGFLGGNYGLMDQIAALQWVQNNIEAFGGDKNNVTIAGQSAGAVSVTCLIASPLAKGLFAKAIAESGAGLQPNAPRTLELKDLDANVQNVFQQLGVSSLDEARKLPAEKLLQAKGRFAPAVDGILLTDKPGNIFSTGKQNAVPLLVGSNQNEDSSYTINAFIFADVQSKKAPAYLYRFTRKLPATSEYVKYGAFHTGEVPYAYNNLRFVNRAWEPIDHQLANTMNQYWVNFAKSGDPNGKPLPEWPVFSNQNSILYLGDRTAAGHLQIKY